MSKPSSTWQVYRSEEDILVVHVGNENSEIYFEGPPEFYDGSAVEPKAPSARYRKYMEMVREFGESEEKRAERLACYKQV